MSTTPTLPDPVTLQDSAVKQTKENVLIAPAEDVQGEAVVATITLALANTTTSNNVFAYIIGLSINDNGAVCLVQSDGSAL